MSLYKTQKGDRIDLIVLRHYGDLTHLNDVISANKHLFNKPLNLLSNIDIELPDFTYLAKNDDEKIERTILW